MTRGLSAGQRTCARQRRTRDWCVAAVTAAIAACMTLRSTAHAQCYEIVTHEWGPPVCSGDPIDVYPQDINVHHAVCGSAICIGSEKAFVWWGPDQFEWVPVSSAYSQSRAISLNDDGWIVGFHGPRGFLYRDDAVELILPPDDRPGTDVITCSEVNNHGVIVGTYKWNLGSESTGYIWQDGKYFLLEDVLPGPDCGAYAISDSGYVVGFTGNTQISWDRQAFRYDMNTGEVVLYPKPKDWPLVEATTVSEDGIVGAYGRRPGNAAARLGLIYLGDEMIVVPPLPQHTGLNVYAIAGPGLVFGNSGGSVGDAILWDGTATRDLTRYIVDHDTDLLPSSVMARAPDGALVLAADYQYFAQEFAIAVPVPPKPHDLDANCRVGMTDLVRLISQWGPGEHREADFDENGVVDILDLMSLLDAWDSD